jgi:hypothetical protein
VNPKPFLDAWVAEAVAKVPDLIASFQPKPAAEDAAAAAPVEPVDDTTMPQILLNTGLTRRFTGPSLSTPPPPREEPVVPPTPEALAKVVD